MSDHERGRLRHGLERQRAAGEIQRAARDLRRYVAGSHPERERAARDRGRPDLELALIAAGRRIEDLAIVLGHGERDLRDHPRRRLGRDHRAHELATFEHAVVAHPRQRG